LEGITFTAGVPSLTPLGTAATSNSNAFQPAITGVANEVFGGTGPGMIALTSSYLPLSSMGTILGGVWNGTAIARAYGGLNSTSAGTGLLRDGTTPTASEISGDCTTSGSNAITCTKTNGTSFAAVATSGSAADLSSGTLAPARLPSPAGGGPPGGVAAITSPTGAISTSETSVVSYTIPANTIQAGTTYRIKAAGQGTSSAANTSDLRVRFGSTGSCSSSDTNLGTVALTGATSGTNITFSIDFLITFQSTTVSELWGQFFNNGATGIYTAATPVQLAPTNTTGLTTTSNEVLEFCYVSSAGTTSANFSLAEIELVKP